MLRFNYSKRQNALVMMCCVCITFRNSGIQIKTTPFRVVIGDQLITITSLAAQDIIYCQQRGLTPKKQ